MSFRSLCLVVSVLLLSLVHAQEATPTLMVSPADDTDAGTGGWAVHLVALNPGPTTIYYQPPAILTAAVAGAGQPVDFRADDETQVVLAPGSFASRRYAAVRSPTVNGTVVLEFAAGLPRPVRTVLNVQTAAPSAPPEESGEDTLRHLTNLTPADRSFERAFVGRFGLHEPIYFIYGTEAPAAKFQFSFKYRMLDLVEPAPGRFSHSLQAAYTQRSLWDLGADSSPFYDTSYMPELMLETLAPAPTTQDGWFTPLGLQVFLKHESNGQGGTASRSLNTAGVRAAALFGPLDAWHLIFVPEAFGYITELDDNPDLKDYRGYGQLRFFFSRDARHPALLYTVRAGQSFERWTHQFDITLPIRTQRLNIETSLLLQYFNGYGESLRSYRQKSDALRAGISLVR